MSQTTGLVKALRRLRTLKEKGEKDIALVDILILLELFEVPSVKQADLSNRLDENDDISEVVLSHSLKKLIEKYKFVSRTSAPENYRLNILALTAKGRTFITDLLGDLKWQSDSAVKAIK